jgi:hypothetical protein
MLVELGLEAEVFELLAVALPLYVVLLFVL